jgi:putative transposase
MAVKKVMERHGLSQRHACRLVNVDRSTLRYQDKRPDDSALRQRLRELAAERRRFGYRRLGWMLAREGHAMNHKRLYRLYREERLMVRRRGRRKRALGTRAPILLPHAINQRWSLDFVSDTLSDGRRFRILCVVDDFSRECLATVVDTSLSGVRVVRELERLGVERAMPQVVVSDNELSKKAMARDEHTSALARRASNAGYDCAIVEKTCLGPVACVAAHRQGFARTARRLTPPLTGAATAAEWVISGR